MMFDRNTGDGRQTEQTIAEEPDKLHGEGGPPQEKLSGRALLLLSVAALGVVFGDIGTSPLYAIRECFLGRYPIPPTPPNVFGILSLIFWSLIIVISVKYLMYVMRADNEGEGGILALMALLSPWREGYGRHRRLVISLGVFGAALLYGDGILTPAISVLSAIEGLKVATPGLDPFVVPITGLILVLLFLSQKRGTARVGAVFGPVMLVWFGTLAVLGVVGVLRHPQVLAAVIPTHAIRFFLDNQWHGFLVLGAVFLVITGGEALYADMGHFTPRTIRLAWFSLVLPALLLNYFGQGALLLTSPREVSHPFYHLAPDWAVYPLVILATMATVIASQAVISGVFSLSRQAAFLELLPRLRVVQTSSERIGQIYIPSINWFMMIATLWLVFEFRKSTNLAAAYGVAVSTTMVITTILAFLVARERWKWSRFLAFVITIAFLSVDCGFFGANLFRIVEGGWIPLLIGAIVFALMSTWKRGRHIVRERLKQGMLPLESFMQGIVEHPPLRVPGTAVFMSGNQQGTPPMMLHHLKHNQVLHEKVILLTVIIEDVPRVGKWRRLEVQEWGQGIFRVLLRFGFMDDPDVPKALQRSRRLGLDTNPDTMTYYVGGQIVIPSQTQPGMALWRERLYVFMARNAAQAITFYRLPADRVIEVGIQIEM